MKTFKSLEHAYIRVYQFTKHLKLHMKIVIEEKKFDDKKNTSVIHCAIVYSEIAIFLHFIL
jgi:hypothetical protein